MDFLTKAERSIRMSAIKGRHNKTTEVLFAVLLREHKIIGWRRHLRLPGCPDFAFKKFKIAVFIDGCFWHGCPIHYRKPSSNREFWRLKVESNRTRDARVTRELRRRRWSVLRIWEHDLKEPAKVVRRIKKAIDRGTINHQ